MEIPLMTDSENENESFILSEDTIIEHEEEVQIRAVADAEYSLRSHACRP
jgi:hypothetical protein